MPLGGRLTISAENRTIAQSTTAGRGTLSPGDYIVITVSDTGAGIPEHVIDRVLEPFFTTKDVGKGTGLGLSQIYGFVRQSRGELSIDSVEGEGTAVTLFLPRHAGSTSAQPRVVSLPAPPPRAQHPPSHHAPTVPIRRASRRGRGGQYV